ncbi:hypothetical protein ACP70R_032642 [Stipagrostis hirtigluma subsp. patula]
MRDHGDGSSKTVRVTTIVFIVLLGCLAFPALCGRRSHPDGFLNAKANDSTRSSRTSEESKLTLIFCKKTRCDFVDGGWQNCYCCTTSDDADDCYRTREECSVKCPVCNPKCPSPRPSIEEDQASHAKINASLYK